MKMCTDHWGKLRAAVAASGMDGLVAQSGEDAANRLIAEAKSGTATKQTFDPLMCAHNAIVLNAVDFVGLDLLVQNEDGTDRCPLCFIAVDHAAKCKEAACTWSPEGWIGYAVRDARERAIELGLIASA